MSMKGEVGKMDNNCVNELGDETIVDMLLETSGSNLRNGMTTETVTVLHSELCEQTIPLNDEDNGNGSGMTVDNVLDGLRGVCTPRENGYHNPPTSTTGHPPPPLAPTVDMMMGTFLESMNSGRSHYSSHCEDFSTLCSQFVNHVSVFVDSSISALDHPQLTSPPINNIEGEVTNEEDNTMYRDDLHVNGAEHLQRLKFVARCRVCNETFNEDVHRPAKDEFCGHIYCRACVLLYNSCPRCALRYRKRKRSDRM